MKSIICACIVFLSSGLCAQKSNSVRDFLPDLFYTKQSLTDHYQYSDLNYKALLSNLESKPREALQILFRDSSQIIYTEIYSDHLKPDTISLRFNAAQRLIEWTSSIDACNDTHSGDMPLPIISHSYFTYDPGGQIKNITGYCSDKSYSVRSNFYYNGQNVLDSIVHLDGYSELYVYQKIILIHPSNWSGENKSSIALILNTPFDYVNWLKENLSDTAYFDTIHNRLPDSYCRFTKNIHDPNNYMYEFDSLGRVTSYAVLNERAEFGFIVHPIGCDVCEENCNSTGKLDFYYADNKINGVEFMSFGNSNSENNCRCTCLMRIHYKKEKIKEITFHALLNETDFVFEKKWTPKKGFQHIPKTGEDKK